MASKLQEILAALSENELRQRAQKYDSRLSSFNCPATITSPQDFFKVVRDFLTYLGNPDLQGPGGKTLYNHDVVALIYRNKDPQGVYAEHDHVLLEEAVYDAMHGKMRNILGAINEVVKGADKKSYVDMVFLTHAAMWDDQCEVAKELFSLHGSDLPPYMNRANPMAYARECKWVIMKYLERQQIQKAP